MSNDPETLAQLHAECFPNPWGVGTFVSLLAQPGVRALSGEGGFLLLRTVAGEGEILTLAVAPAHRRQGVARSLVERALAEVEALFLEVSVENHAALKLYQNCGFKEIGRRKAYYADGSDALTMRKNA